MLDDRSFLQAAIGKLRNSYFELGVVAADGIDAGFNHAIVGRLESPGFDPWVVRKGDCERILWIAVFLPALRGCGVSKEEYDSRKRNCAHIGSPNRTPLFEPIALHTPGQRTADYQSAATGWPSTDHRQRGISNGSSATPELPMVLSFVAGLGPRPSAKAVSSTRAPRNIPGRA